MYILLIREATVKPNVYCTYNMKSCDMREDSDWLKVILGYKSLQIFHSVIIFKLKVRTQVQRYRKIDLEDVDIAKNLQIVGLMTKRIKIVGIRRL